MYYTGDYIWGKDTFGDYLKDWEKIAKDFNKQLVENPIKIVQNVYKSVKDKTLTIEIELAGVKKEDIRKRDNYRCQECFRHQDELRTKNRIKNIFY
jgi:ribosomal protein S13